MSDSQNTGTLPPGPRLPAAVQAAWLYRDLVGSLELCRRRLGPVFHVRIPGIPPFVYVTEPGDVRALYKHDGALAGDARRPFLEPMVGEHSVLCLEGEAWERQRRLLAPPLHGERVLQWQEEIVAITEHEIEQWPQSSAFPVRPRMQNITLEVILRLVFGLDSPHERDRLRGPLIELLDAVDNPVIFGLPDVRERLERSVLARRLPGSPLRRFLRARERVDALLFAAIARRRADGEQAAGRTDVLSALVVACDGNDEAMSDAEIRDELLTLLTAGHETTATALAWTVERLTRHPSVLRRLIDELDAGQTDYLQAVIKETLRQRPVIFDTPRALTKPITLGGHEVPAGWWAAPAIPLVHTDPERFPDPGRFDPERFLGDDSPVTAWIPFGGGNRRCLGSRLALLELGTVITTILRSHTLLPTSSAPEAQRLQHVTLAPAEGAMVSLRRR